MITWLEYTVQYIYNYVYQKKEKDCTKCLKTDFPDRKWANKTFPQVGENRCRGEFWQI